MENITLTVDPEIIAEAKKIADEQGTTVSSMFSRIVRSLAKQRNATPEIGRLARQATGLGKATEGKTDREVLEEALLEKYGMNQ